MFRTTAFLVAVGATTGCMHEYHPEYHPEWSYTYVQNVRIETPPPPPPEPIVVVTEIAPAPVAPEPPAAVTAAAPRSRVAKKRAARPRHAVEHEEVSPQHAPVFLADDRDDRAR